jgi:Raf kinase inhibitor-like YbhB/YbcL family protein
MKLSSSAFGNNGLIPAKYTCDGGNVNPPLTIGDVDDHTVSLVLTMHDPDVPSNIRADNNWDHWLVWNIDPGLREIKEDTSNIGISGKNTSGMNSYTGPCPPDREHRYIFNIYSLDCCLSLPPDSTRQDLEKAISGHIIDKACLIGRYNRT